MDRATNPFAPGAGTEPPELAGRSALLEDASVAIRRARAGRPARGMLLLGLRGVGKTVLLNRIAALAEEHGGVAPVVIEAPEGEGLAALMVPPLRRLLLRLSAGKRAADHARRALRALRNFASVFRVKLGELEVGVEPDRGVADSGQLDLDLGDLLEAAGLAAKDEEAVLVLVIDELQYLPGPDLSALIVALHRMEQRRLPVLLFGAGLPHLAGLAGEARSYAERLFEYPLVGRLPAEAAAAALREPLRREGVSIESDALALLVEVTEGYPYFLQEYGYHVWNEAVASPVTVADARRAARAAMAHLDGGFFRVRFDRLTPREKDYLRAMAELGAGPHRSGAVARVLGEAVQAVAQLRQALILKGMIYSPAHGDTAFTVPMFDGFLRRAMPDWTPPPPEQRPRKRGRPRRSP